MLLCSACALAFFVGQYSLYRRLLRKKRLDLLYNSPLPGIWSDTFVNMAPASGFCGPYEGNEAAEKMLTGTKAVDVILLLVTSSVTFESRAQVVYDLYSPMIHSDMNMTVLAITDGAVRSRSNVPTLSNQRSGSTKTDFQERLAEFVSLILLPCLPQFRYILLLDDDTLVNPERLRQELLENPLYNGNKASLFTPGSKDFFDEDDRDDTRIFSGVVKPVCNVMCGGAGMLMSRDLLMDVRKHSDVFFRRYGVGYSKYFDARLSRFILEVLRVRPRDNEKFLNDPPPTIDPEALDGVITVHHCFEKPVLASIAKAMALGYGHQGEQEE